MFAAKHRGQGIHSVEMLSHDGDAVWTWCGLFGTVYPPRAPYGTEVEVECSQCKELSNV